MHIGRYPKQLWYMHWNRCKFKILGAKLGNNVKLVNKVYLHMGENTTISIGNNVVIYSGDNLNPLSSNTNCSIFVTDNAELEIGDWSGMSGGCIWSTDRISIGSHVNIGANCIIMDGDIHNTDWAKRRLDRTTKEDIKFNHGPIVIEDDVWLGANCIVLKNVTIGCRSIIGAGSVVTKSIPADCIAAGNPCKIIRMFKGGVLQKQTTVSLKPQSDNDLDSAGVEDT